MPTVTKASGTVPVIAPTAVYSIEQAQAALGLKRTTLAREIRLGRLRVARRGGKYLVLGKWLLQWIEAGELTREPTADPQANGEGRP
jgi:hypothetical protein